MRGVVVVIFGVASCLLTSHSLPAPSFPVSLQTWTNVSIDLMTGANLDMVSPSYHPSQFNRTQPHSFDAPPGGMSERLCRSQGAPSVSFQELMIRFFISIVQIVVENVVTGLCVPLFS